MLGACGRAGPDATAWRGRSLTPWGIKARDRDDEDIRRDCCRRALCRFAHGDAASPKRIPRAGSRSRHISQPDTVSTHILHPRGVDSLARWGLLQHLTATGCPPIHTYAFDFGAFTIVGAPGTSEMPVAYCPRRTILDKLLVDAAAEAGAEVREGFTVEEILIEDGRVTGIKGRSKHGDPTVERANIVVGADGRQSIVADAVRPERYNERRGTPARPARESRWPRDRTGDRAAGVEPLVAQHALGIVRRHVGVDAWRMPSSYCWR